MGIIGESCLFSRGQIDVDEDSRVQNEGDIQAQTAACIDHVKSILAESRLSPKNITHFNCYFTVGKGTVETIDSHLRTELFGDDEIPVTFIPVPYFYFDGLEVEVDFVASCKVLPVATSRQLPGNDGWVRESRAGDDVFLAGYRTLSYAEDKPGEHRDRILEIVESLQSIALQDGWPTVSGKIWCYIQSPTRAVYEAIATHLPGSNSCWDIRAIPLVTPASDEVALCFSGYATNEVARHHTFRTADTSISIRSCSRFAFIDLATPPGNRDYGEPGSRYELVEQTKALMLSIEHALASIGLDFTDVLKNTAYYTGGPVAEDLYANLLIRDGFYEFPGPASTGVPMRTLEQQSARITVSLQLSAARIKAA